jgi:peptide/nickel transport system substrate-binding protein
VIAVDDRTVDIVFTRVYPEMFFDAVFHVRVMPHHILGSVPRDQLVSHEFGRAPIGSGPFRFVQWEAAEFVELAGEPDYHRGRPGVPRIVWRFTAGGPQSLTQLLAGEADIFNPVARSEDQERVEEHPELRLIPYAVPVYAYIAFNFRDPDDVSRPHPLFADDRVRAAVTQLVDVQAIVDGVFGDRGYRAIGPLTAVFGELYESLDPAPHLVDNALGALSSLGWTDTDDNGVRDKDGQEMEFDLLVPSSSASRVRSAEILQEQLRAFDIKVNIVEMEFQAALDQAALGRFDTFFGALAHDPSPSSVADAFRRIQLRALQQS